MTWNLNDHHPNLNFNGFHDNLFRVQQCNITDFRKLFSCSIHKNHNFLWMWSLENSIWDETALYQISPRIYRVLLEYTPCNKKTYSIHDTSTHKISDFSDHFRSQRIRIMISPPLSSSHRSTWNSTSTSETGGNSVSGGSCWDDGPSELLVQGRELLSDGFPEISPFLYHTVQLIIYIYI